MDKDERQASAGIDFWEGGTLGKSGLGTLYRTIMLENVSVDVVDGARVKGVLGCPSVPGRTEGVKVFFSTTVEYDVLVAGFRQKCVHLFHLYLAV